MASKKAVTCDQVAKLEQIPNVGPRTAENLRRLGVLQPADLQQKDPVQLYDQLCALDGVRYDPCVLDVFMAATDFMNGNPAQPWWNYTPRRKREWQLREEAKRKEAERKEAERAAQRLGRRALLVSGVLTLTAAQPLTAALWSSEPDTDLRFSLLTDLHYADKDPTGTRHYRETPAKLAEAARELADFQPQFIVELGDVIDAAESVQQELQYLRTIHRQLEALPGDNHYVLGNHCVYWLTKQEFLETVLQERSYYSFDQGGLHLVVLDGCFRSDGQPYGRKNYQWTDSNLSADQLKWLEADLRQAARPTIVFVHQRLDAGGNYGIKNAADARQILERSGHVLAVFQGHNHKNDYREIAGIHYCTLQSLVDGSGKENNALANVTVDAQGTIRVRGFLRQKSYTW